MRAECESADSTTTMQPIDAMIADKRQKCIDRTGRGAYRAAARKSIIRFVKSTGLEGDTLSPWPRRTPPARRI